MKTRTLMKRLTRDYRGESVMRTVGVGRCAPSSAATSERGRGRGRSSRAASRDAVSDRRFEHVEVDVAKGAELDAVARHTRLAEFRAIGLGEVCLVVESHDVHGDPGGV